jgi:FtsP/CotA-like multicopper oxidase with cupredoxin domain
MVMVIAYLMTRLNIGEQDFYIPKNEQGQYKAYDNIMGSMNETLEVMKTLTPSHVVFNGAVGTLTGKNAMTAKVGETVLFIHSQANRDTRPHLIGGHNPYVWNTGSFSADPRVIEKPGTLLVAELVRACILLSSQGCTPM